MARGTRIAVVTCYRHPDYVRAITLRRAAADCGAFDEVVVVKNSRRGILRYPQVALQLLRMRGAHRPDAYLVTFRAHEILPWVLVLAGRRPVFYDEFINPVEWFVLEHRKFSASSLPAKILRAAFRRLMSRTAGVLADTASHADLSAELMEFPRDRYHVVPVGNDDESFPRLRLTSSGSALRVLYYGSMLPLHGLDHVFEAAVLARDRVPLVLVLVGGDETVEQQVERARSRGAEIEYTRWVPFERLSELMAGCDLLLGGPFGATVQSRFVITGKTFQGLASGVPTVIGLNHESGAFTAGENVMVVPQGDATALADAFVWAFGHRDELARIGSNGRDLYERLWGREAIAAALGLAFEHAPQVHGAGGQE